MSLPLNTDCRSHVFRALPLSDLRAVRRVCRAFRDESQDAYWQALLRDQFESPPSVVAASAKETFQAAFADSKASMRHCLATKAKGRMAAWKGVEKEAPGWATEHRLAVADAFWGVANAYLSGPPITIEDVIRTVDALLEMLPPQTPSPTYQRALDTVASLENVQKLKDPKPARGLHLARLREELAARAALKRLPGSA